jgi:hypothetical protein
VLEHRQLFALRLKDGPHLVVGASLVDRDLSLSLEHRGGSVRLTSHIEPLAGDPSHQKDKRHGRRERQPPQAGISPMVTDLTFVLLGLSERG